MRVNLLQIVDYLLDNHDRFYVLPGKDGALVYDGVEDAVVVIWDNFDCPPTEQVAKLKMGLRREHAWLN
jgi:hypothetical protein